MTFKILQFSFLFPRLFEIRQKIISNLFKLFKLTVAMIMTLMFYEMTIKETLTLKSFIILQLYVIYELSLTLTEWTYKWTQLI